MRYTDSTRTMIDVGGGRYVPATPGNSDYDAIIASAEEIADADPAPPSVPAYVSRCQAKLALYTHGLLSSADAAASGAGGSTAIYWNEATVFERAHPIVDALGSQLGLSAEDIDALFVEAAAL